MGFNFKTTKQKFGMLTDVRAVTDPWGLGITFLIRRKGHPAYRSFTKTELPKNDFQKAMERELAREQLRASMTGKRMDKSAALDRAIDKADITAESGVQYVDWNIRRVATLLEGWEGEDVPFSFEAACELLSLENPIEPAEPYATHEVDLDPDQLEVEAERAASEGREAKTTRTVNRTLGAAIAAFIEEEADKESLYLEGLEKNSAASSAGAPVSSAD